MVQNVQYLNGLPYHVTRPFFIYFLINSLKRVIVSSEIQTYGPSSESLLEFETDALSRSATMAGLTRPFENRTKKCQKS